jgi:hypothetical protein
MALSALRALLIVAFPFVDQKDPCFTFSLPGFVLRRRLQPYFNNEQQSAQDIILHPLQHHLALPCSLKVQGLN